MHLTVLGSSGTFPSIDNPASGYLVTGAEATVVLDLGPGTYAPLKRRVVAPSAIVLSHVHPDHCADLFPFFNSLRFSGEHMAPVTVFAPEGLVDRFAEFLDAPDDHPLHTMLSFDTVAAGAERTVGDMVLRFGAATHPVPALVTSVERAGRRLVYSGDTGPGGDLEELARGSDVLLCEATHQGSPGEDRYPYHLHAVEAGEIARRAGVGSLIVTHIPPTLDPAISVGEASREYDGPVSHAVPDMEVEV